MLVEEWLELTSLADLQVGEDIRIETAGNWSSPLRFRSWPRGGAKTGQALFVNVDTKADSWWDPNQLVRLVSEKRVQVNRYHERVGTHW
jgi:hypothetical protein